MINKVKKRRKIKKIYIILLQIVILLLTTPFTYSRYISKYTKSIVISASQPRYTVEFNSNNADNLTTTQDFVYGTSQKLNKCTFGTAEDYAFLEWNTTADGTGTSYADEEVVNNLTSEHGKTITLYAIYARQKYIHDGDIDFDGQTTILNTGVYLFNEENIKKDFEVSFVVKNRGANTSYQNGNYPTIMSAMSEKGAPWPGMVYRVFNDWDDQLIFNVSGVAADNYNLSYHPAATQKVTLKRINGAIYLSINDEPEEELMDVSSMTDTFDYPVVFGASLDGNMNPQRWFEGTLSNLKVLVTEPNANVGTITYDPNGGSGHKLFQHILTNETETYILKKNTYTNYGYIFDGWNTDPYGNGTSYTDEQEVTNLVESGQRIHLYAQWKRYKYKVEFNPNDGEGNITQQEFDSGVYENLDPSTMKKEGYSFAFWNTEPNGSGVSYEDNESVLNIGTYEGEVVTLYAMYEQFSYQSENDLEFTGANYINTHIYLFSRKNVHKDFEISFEIKNYINTGHYDTLISSLDESGTPYPGFVFRINDSEEITDGTEEYNLEANASSPREVYNRYPLTTKKVIIRRVNGVLYLKLDDNAEEQIIDYSTLTRSFYYPLTVGASLNEEFTAWRYFNGTISNLKITLSEPTESTELTEPSEPTESSESTEVQ